LRFDLRSEGRVVVRVFDVEGREVALLHDAAREAGPHVIFWDGRRAAGGLANPGVYFLRAATREGAAIGKVTLLP
jgi:flagellar hook assembly protein FlgD